MLGGTEGIYWRIARRRLRGITQQAVLRLPRIPSCCCGSLRPSGGCPSKKRGVLVVELFVMEANTSNNVLFDLYDLIG